MSLTELDTNPNLISPSLISPSLISPDRTDRNLTGRHPTGLSIRLKPTVRSLTRLDTNPSRTSPSTINPSPTSRNPISPTITNLSTTRLITFRPTQRYRTRINHPNTFLSTEPLQWKPMWRSAAVYGCLILPIPPHVEYNIWTSSIHKFTSWKPSPILFIFS